MDRLSTRMLSNKQISQIILVLSSPSIWQQTPVYFVQKQKAVLTLYNRYEQQQRTLLQNFECTVVAGIKTKKNWISQIYSLLIYCGLQKLQKIAHKKYKQFICELLYLEFCMSSQRDRNFFLFNLASVVTSVSI